LLVKEKTFIKFHLLKRSVACCTSTWARLSCNSKSLFPWFLEWAMLKKLPFWSFWSRWD